MKTELIPVIVVIIMIPSLLIVATTTPEKSYEEKKSDFKTLQSSLPSDKEIVNCFLADDSDYCFHLLRGIVIPKTELGNKGWLKQHFCNPDRHCEFWYKVVEKEYRGDFILIKLPSGEWAWSDGFDCILEYDHRTRCDLQLPNKQSYGEGLI